MTLRGIDLYIVLTYLAAVIGIGFYAKRRKPDVDDYVNAIDYVVQRVGIDYAAIGMAFVPLVYSLFLLTFNALGQKPWVIFSFILAADLGANRVQVFRHALLPQILPGLVAGVDEAGRGPLAGPVVAAAVILPRGFTHPEIKDSKMLSAKQREKLAPQLWQT